jgi:hypothetical protein
MPKLIILILCLSVLGCANSVKPPESYAYDNTKPIGPQFYSIQLDNGIDSREADILATVYFSKYEGACGGNMPVVRRGRFWHSLTLVGSSGHQNPDIKIDSRSGIVGQKGHPTSIPPWDDLRAYADEVIAKLQQ